MKAVILAAGLGSRLSSISSGRPKCLLELRGKPILLHQLDLLAGCGVTKVEVVTGFAADQVRSCVGGRAECVYYPDFASTNNLMTLDYCRRLLSGDMLLLFADVLLSGGALRECIARPCDFGLLIDTSRCLEGTMRVRVAGGSVLDIGQHIPPSVGDGNFIGVARYSARGAELLAAELRSLAATGDYVNAYYTAALPPLAARGYRLEGIDLRGRPWLEVDTAEDYLNAQAKTFYLSAPGGPPGDGGRA